MTAKNFQSKIRDHWYPKEISWLAFNERVLQEAEDPNVPIIERLRFLGIYSNNQDEFFKVRIAELKRQVLIAQASDRSFTEHILKDAIKKSGKLTEKFNIIYHDLLNELKKYNIEFKNENQINDFERKWIRSFFTEKVKPFISPVILTEELDVLSFLKDPYTYLCIEMSEQNDKKQYALLEIPTDKVDRIIQIPNEDPNSTMKILIMLDDIIRVCLDDVFKGFFNYSSITAYCIKMNRDAEYNLSMELNRTMIESMSEGLKQRLTAIPTRLAYDRDMPKEMVKFLVKKLKMSDYDSISAGNRYHNMKDFLGFPSLGNTSLEYNRVSPLHCYEFDRYPTMFQAISKQDILLYYPYYTFSYFTELLRQSSYDPSVIAIKINIYRVARDSRVIRDLIDAANNGKRVTVVVELKARFDESNNIEWAKILTEAGVKVLFGLPSLKIHSKLCLITRKEEGKLVKYCHIGTGNFNEKSARIYTDFALFTKNEQLTEEVDSVFDFIEAPYIQPRFKNLMVSPVNARQKIYDLIDNEITNATKGLEASITVKINNLVDEGVIARLYRASQAGVKINMIVRGMCSLITGVKNLSTNINIRSIVDRYLEHPRVMIFHNNGDEKIYISSADWMTRNLDHRIEVATPIFSKKLKKVIKDLIDIQFNDNVKARIIDEKQTNRYVERTATQREIRSQMEIYEYLENLEEIKRIQKKK
ncbi:MAG: polyphosphate kinase 1 [Succinivibrionaceae bacterium]|jgi:polyphosphate kinase|nr:polyphosphate kinase 1 [Succinivibrionaceae bacterium]